ncbi:hypothetical protein F5B21DRAFT_519839 [Xylaria acuta]|nr:hypothetical protein F5B21DRAFT_519839 [Xylaria acuta]
MRLLKTNKPDRLQLVEVSEEFAPEYAILSHTWGNEEVMFQDIQALGRRQWSQAISQTVSTIRAKKGFVKINKAAALAAEHGYGFIWVDTCCIDKTSSAELSEAINSMFRWYKKASICYAYMEDVKHGYCDTKGGLFHLLCQHSRWFTRGRTLQELIAPEDVIFYGEDWGCLGSKAHDEDVRISLADITGIDVRVLEGIIPPGEMSIAARMKWASGRETTRLEDAAYCLMGLFDVNMPLLYGEGTKAFIRLQEEILKGSNDHSIFTWKTPDYGYDEALSGLLAESPEHFIDVENYRPIAPLVSQRSTTWSMTNQGLRLSLFLLPSRDSDDNRIRNVYDAVLECAIRYGDGAYQSPTIRMRRLYGDQFARVDTQIVKREVTPSFDSSHGFGSYEIVFVKQKPVYELPDFMASYSNIFPSSGSHGPDHSCYITGVWPEQHWDNEAGILRTTPPHSNQITGLFRFFAPWLATTIDFARPSEGEPLRQAVLSVNGYLASISQNLQQPIRTPDWLVHPWKEESEIPQIQIRLEKIKVHGRLYHFIKASSSYELQGQLDPALSGIFDVEERPTENGTILIQKPMSLENLMEDITIPNSEFNGFRPIHWAVVGGHIEAIRILLDGGADFYSRTIQGWSSIHLAALFGRFVTMKWLIEYAIERHASSYEDELLLGDRGNTLRESPLHLAVSHVYPDGGDEFLALTEILKHLGGSTFWTSPNHAGETSFHRLAASCGTWSPSKFLSTTERLRKHKRQFIFPGRYLDELGRTVLWHAVSTGSLSAVKYFITHDATSLSMADKNGMTPLHVACRLGYGDVARALLQAGANPNVTTTTPGLTAAHYAAMYYGPSCLMELIDHGADVHKPTDSAEISIRPIHLAAANRNWESFFVLLDAGADIEWRCTYYICKRIIFQEGAPRRRNRLVECNKSVGQLMEGKTNLRNKVCRAQEREDGNGEGDKEGEQIHILFQSSILFRRSLDEKWAADRNFFVVTSAVLQPLTGQLADALGRRGPIIASTALFTLGSGIAGGAHNPAMLIAGRVAQGIGTGGFSVLLGIVCCELVPLRKRGKHLGLLFSWLALAALLFFMRVKSGGPAASYLAEDPEVRNSKSINYYDLTLRLKRLDYFGNAFFTLSMIPLLFGLVEGGTVHAWSSWRIILPLVFGIAGWTAFHTQQVFAAQPSVLTRLFANRTSATGYLLTFLSSIIVQALAYFLPVYFQAVKSTTILVSGVDFLLLAISTLAFVIIAGVLLSRIGRCRPLHGISLAISAVAFGLLTRLGVNTPTVE